MALFSRATWRRRSLWLAASGQARSRSTVAAWAFTRRSAGSRPRGWAAREGRRALILTSRSSRWGCPRPLPMNWFWAESGLARERHAAVDNQRLAGDETGLVAGEE